MKREARSHLRSIFTAGLRAADPAAALRRALRLEGETLRAGPQSYDLSATGRIILVGAGKASAAMARAVIACLGERRISDGWVTIPSGVPAGPLPVTLHRAGHPLPDKAGETGAREIVRRVRGLTEKDLVLFCLSGGGSALLPLPAGKLTLEDKRCTTQALLACGADIDAVNTVRKHLSGIKGGHLARLAFPARVLTLILSDVIGDRLDTIASGPTAPDGSTYAQAMEILKRYKQWGQVPAAVRQHLVRGAAGKHLETPAAGDPVFNHVQNLVVAGNRLAVAAAAQRARTLGYRPLVLTSRLCGEAREAARILVAIAREAADAAQPVKPPACLIAGGETTVTLRGPGKGGRNQEFALAAALAMQGTQTLSVLAAGTDGADGPTDAAGAFADGDTCRRAAAQGVDAGAHLERNDAYPFFSAVRGHLKTGPTGTNVMDLYLLLIS